MQVPRSAPQARRSIYARILLLLAVLAMLSVTVVACGGGGSSSESSDTEATTSESTETSTESEPESEGSSELAAMEGEIEELLQRPTQISLTEPLDPSKKVPSGKLIYFIGCGLPVCEGIGKYFEEAGQQFGWKTKYINAGLTPETIKAAWERTAREKPDAVLVSTGGVPKEIYKTELAELKAAGIPVVFNSEVFEPNPAEGVIGVVNGPARQDAAAEAQAKWLTVKTNGEGNILLVTSSALANQVTTADAIKEKYLPEYCPKCQITIYDAPITSVGKDLPEKIAQQLRTNPDVNYMLVQGGNFAIGLPAALANAGLEGQAPILIQSQDPTTSQDLKNGKYEAIYGLGLPELMWMSADIFARYWTDQSTKPDEEADDIQEWFITAETVPSTTEDYPMVEDYQAQFKELWNK